MPKKPNTTKNQSKSVRPKLVIAPDAISRFASNVAFDSNIWGMRIQFGEIVTEDGEMVVKQHTTITMPWLLAKILTGYLLVNVAGHEAATGELQVPTRFLPAIPITTATGEVDADKLAFLQEKARQAIAIIGGERPDKK